MCTIPLFVDNLFTEFQGTVSAHLRPYLVRRFRKIKLFPAASDAIRKNFLIGGLVPCSVDDKIFIVVSLCTCKPSRCSFSRLRNVRIFRFDAQEFSIPRRKSVARKCYGNCHFIFYSRRVRHAEIMCN